MSRKYYSFSSGNFTKLDIVVIRQGNVAGSVKILQESITHDIRYFNFDCPEFYSLHIDPQKNYQIETNDVFVNLLYFYNDNVLEEGVTFFDPDTNKMVSAGEFARWKNQKFRNCMHFSPVRNWMNDPNGLCFYRGLYHLFYQYNPMSQQWGNMFWGHAVSKDMIRWRYLPIAFIPQTELQGLEGFRGGAFSGSALVFDEKLMVYFTRHFGKNDRSWQREWQVSSISKDGYSFSPEKTEVIQTPPGVTGDFRDPKVFEYDGCRYMVLAGRCENKASISLYKMNEYNEWKYINILYLENDTEYRIAECPDLFPLDGKWVLAAGFMSAAEKTSLNSVKRDVCYYIGSFDGETFRVENQGLCDFGKDFYATQTFAHENRRILMAWNNDMLKLHQIEDDSSNGTLSIPRELCIRDGRLYSAPVKEMEVLESKKLFDSSAEKISFYDIPDRTYKLTLSCTALENCYIVLARGENGFLFVSYDNGTFTMGWKNNGVIHQAEYKTEKLEELAAYIDNSLLEVFINKGEGAGSLRYYLENCSSLVEAEVKASSVRCAGISLNNIWEE